MQSAEVLVRDLLAQAIINRVDAELAPRRRRRRTIAKELRSDQWQRNIRLRRDRRKERRGKRVETWATGLPDYPSYAMDFVKYCMAGDAKR